MYSCKLCKNADTEQMVQCDLCDQWFHFECVNVTKEISNVPWTCETCKSASASNAQTNEGVNSSQKGETLTKITSSKSTVLSNKLKMLKLERAKEEYQLEKQYLRKKYELLEASVSCTGSQSSRKSIKNIPIAPKHEMTNDWVNQQQNVTTIKAKENVLSASNIATRQLMGNNLPKFNGDPKDWPLFISQYENSTLKCNFSNDENLIRLQRCLSGAALEAVKFNLLSPELVPSIISTLRTLYGRPEIIISSLIKKVRQEPPPKPGNLSDLIKFSLEIKNLTSTMVATNCRQYLNDITLMSELIRKTSVSIIIRLGNIQKKFSS